jgi:hypothetical protein
MKLLNDLKKAFIAQLDKHRLSIVKYCAMDYKARIFNKEVSYLRIVPIILSCFYTAIIATVLIDNTGIWFWLQSQAAFIEVVLSILTVIFIYLPFWIPFMISIWIGFPLFGYGYLDQHPVKFSELSDWSQQWQYLQKPYWVGATDESYPQGSQYIRVSQRLEQIRELSFSNKSNVFLLKALLPWIVFFLGAFLSYLALQ